MTALQQSAEAQSLTWPGTSKSTCYLTDQRRPGSQYVGMQRSFSRITREQFDHGEVIKHEQCCALSSRKLRQRSEATSPERLGKEIAMKKLYSIKELEAATSLKRTLLFALLRRGELTRIKVGNRTCVSADSLDAFIVRRSENSVRS